MAVHLLIHGIHEHTQTYPRLQLKQTIGFILKDLLVQLMEHMFMSLLLEEIHKGIGIGKLTRI